MAEAAALLARFGDELPLSSPLPMVDWTVKTKLPETMPWCGDAADAVVVVGVVAVLRWTVLLGGLSVSVAASSGGGGGVFLGASVGTSVAGRDALGGTTACGVVVVVAAVVAGLEVMASSGKLLLRSASINEYAL